MKPWSLPLRTWLTVALVAVILAPVLAYLGTLVMVLGPSKSAPSPWEAASMDALYTATARLTAHGGADWSSPAFQQELTDLLRPVGWTVALIDDRGNFLKKPDRRAAWTATESPESPSAEALFLRLVPGTGRELLMDIVRDDTGRVAGTYMLIQVESDPLLGWAVIAVLVGLTGAVALVVWRVGRAVSQPVHALTQAARQVSEGNLDVAMPLTRVRELNHLSDAFTALRDGLRTSLTQQAAMEEERRFFISAVAHDLRTPLTSVRGYLEGLRDGVAATPEKRDRYTAVALEKTGQLQRLVENLFAYARTEYLNLTPQQEPVDLAELVAQAVESFRPEAESKSVALRLEPGPAQPGAMPPCRLTADRLMLGRVLDNLLENGIRYTPPGGTVTVGWEPASVDTARHAGAPGAGSCRFWVQDSGPGIPEQDQDRVFQPLYRGDRARGSRTGGAGLGLAIARRLVEAHGGTIQVANQEGARFTVTLPTTAK